MDYVKPVISIFVLTVKQENPKIVVVVGKALFWQAKENVSVQMILLNTMDHVKQKYHVVLSMKMESAYNRMIKQI